MSGDSYRIVTRNQGLEIIGRVEISNDYNRTYKLVHSEYQWILEKEMLVGSDSEGKRYERVSNTSLLRLDPSRLLIPPYFLDVDSYYVISLNGIAHYSSDSSNDIYIIKGRKIVTLEVKRSPLVAVITGGNAKRLLRFPGLLWLDGSESYDPDQSLIERKNQIELLSELFLYSWTCAEISPSFSNQCNNSISLNSPTDRPWMLQLKPLLYRAINKSFQLTLTFADKMIQYGSKRRFSKLAAQVQVINEVDPVVNIIFPSLPQRANPNLQIRIEGSVDLY